MAMAPEKAGIGIRRHFTAPGEDPYAALAWELRDARITNYRDGSVAFEQRDVEFPVSWSQNATNIVAQKYFRGQLGSPERERSLRQVADRVVDTITEWGRKDGYFTDDEEAEAFRAELKHLVVHQKAAFNSPVWFNIGVAGEPQQASACQPWHALVSTPEGLVPIGELVDHGAVGAKVFDASGLTSVVAVKANGTKTVLRVRTVEGYSLDVTADHLVWRVRRDDTDGRWVAAGELRPGDQLEWHHTDSWGDGEITRQGVAEAALAGWVQAGGYIVDVDGKGVAGGEVTVSGEAEEQWFRKALADALPGMHATERSAGAGSAAIQGRRLHLDGSGLAAFVKRWGLHRQGIEASVPEALYTAPLPVAAAYLRSLFQAEGWVSSTGAVVGLAMASEHVVRGVQSLLLRFGIFSRVRRVAERRAGGNDFWVLNVTVATDGHRFADEIGFVDPGPARDLDAALAKVGQGAGPKAGAASAPAVRLVEVEAIGVLGDLPVYDIQTESGEYLSGNLRVHNCFILAVEDTMKSILNWYVEEGTIFKGGSGAGINLSSIRSSKETLKGGGAASGPVSFMRGADASAGTIKSGGKTRRAAKMVILNADHPDVEDFIWCKAIEERKARVLRDAGFDMDLDGKDSHSTQYQNANNSVRVTDEFMQAVVEGRDWRLRAVTTGDAVRTLPARDLFRQIAEATWECADPGMQFDTTINRWHTASNTGRINGSNPCSEYMHLDNSACNLASLNLLKFLDGDGRFDVEGFKQAVEVVFTAQEILVGNADYPTEKIAENSRRFRQLGLGYANLGALLMALGLPYDSDQGRAWAASITSLMTGHAYATSGRIASRMGPFAGYEENAEPTNRVLGMHRDASRQIDGQLVPLELLSAAHDAWDTAVELSEWFGVRNSQASVLAPTGCLVGGSLVATDRGLVRLRSLGDPDGAQWQDLDITVATDDGPRRATQFYVNGAEAVVTAETSRGYRIQGTPTHRVRVVDPTSGEWVWRRFAELQAGDLVPLALDQIVGGPAEVPLPPLPEAYWTGEHHVSVPRRMTAELAELVGYFMGDGSLHSRELRFCVAKGDFDVVERLERLGKEVFGIAARVTPRQGYDEVAFSSVRLVQWWEACGFAKHAPSEGHSGKGWRPHIPDAVLHANDREVYGAFVRGVFEADGTVTSGYPSWSTTSPQFAHDVQTLLLALGFPTTRRTDLHRTGWGTSPITVLRLLNTGYAQRWLDEVGFMGGRKRAAAATGDGRQAAPHDHVPLTRAMVDRLAPANDRLRRVLLMEVARGAVSRRAATELYERTQDPELGRLLRFFYDRIQSAELGEDELTYDLSVPANVTYVANGFVSHNTIGLMMDCDTTGIEPDLGLCKTKKLVGGGTMSIVNQTVPRALRRMGYTADQVADIVAYIDEHKSILGAPHLSAEHLPVFACSMGDNVIHYLGHVKMMGAVQPFISGAISKCVAGDTLIASADGLVRIGSLHDGEAPDTFRPEVREVASLGGEAKTDAFYYGGVKPVWEIVLRSGHRLVGTSNHRVLVATPAGLDWRRLDEIEPGEYVATQQGSELWSVLPARFDDFRPSVPCGAQEPVTVPPEMSAELAFLLGAYAAEGHTVRSTGTIVVTNADEGVLDRVATAWRRLFGLQPRIVRQPGKCPGVVVSSKTVVEFLDHLGSGARASDKRIPDAVLRSPRDMVLAFLQGLSLAAYTTVATAPKWGICLDSPRLLDDLQAVLTNLGIRHGRVGKRNQTNGKTGDEVYATGEQAQRLVSLVPFPEVGKAGRAKALMERSFQARDTADVVPGMAPADLYRLIPEGSGLRSELSFLCDPGTVHVTRRSLERVAALPGVVLPPWLQTVLDDDLHFSPVEHARFAGEREVFDLSVPTTHAFVGNGIVNHNTINMPEHVTVEEVEQLHLDAWRLGIKAVAIYRDNCKVAQPLSTTKKDGAAAAAVAALTAPAEQLAAVVVREPVREKLPRRRSSKTFSFRVADCHGYVTVGEYDDGRPGEIFLKVAKQGSTLAGIMDAFAISVSHGLQYGVPLKAFIDMYTNMRFEPAGMTDDPDIRFASSLVDYIFRRLAVEYLPLEERTELGILTVGERMQPTLPGVEESVTPSSTGSDIVPA
ncbi:MAG TPA: LAGLIDADG family homing endonuclease, partial [Acidimicrobiales bacterium]|nr:LAGLIDADG family homing endonuclease [Acidimicrobiales bacterium]